MNASVTRILFAAALVTTPSMSHADCWQLPNGQVFTTPIRTIAGKTLDVFLGKNTQNALISFQTDKGLPPTGSMGGAELEELKKAAIN